MSASTSATSRSVVGSAVMVWTARTVAPMVRMGVVVLVSRWLGAAGLGAYQVMLAILTVFETIPGLGLWPLIVRRVAREPEQARHYLLNGCALSVGASLLLIGPMYAAGAGYDPEVRQGLFVLAWTLAPAVVILVCEAILIARGRPEGIAALRVIENAVLVAATAALLVSGHGVVAVTVAMLVCRFGCAAAAFAWARHVCPPARSGLGWAFVGDLLRETPVYIALSITWALYTRIDVLVLSRLVALDEVGYYGAAQRILSMGQELPQSAVTVVMPMLAAAFTTDVARYALVMRRTTRLFLALSVPVAVGGTVVGERVLTLLFGAAFAPAAAPLAILLWSFIPFCEGKLLGSALLASDRQRADLTINLIVLAVTAALLFVLVPHAGATGAAWAMLASVTLATTLRRFVLTRDTAGLWPDRRILAVAAAGAAMGLALLAAQPFPLGVSLVLGPLVYGAGLLLFGAFEPEELAAVPGIRALAPRAATAAERS